MIDLVLQKFEIESPEAVVPSEPCTLEKFVQKSAYCRLTRRMGGKAKKKKNWKIPLWTFFCVRYTPSSVFCSSKYSSRASWSPFVKLWRCCDLVAHMSVEGGDGLGIPEHKCQLRAIKVIKYNLPKSALCPAMARWRAGIKKSTSDGTSESAGSR